jgi:hypothetical protein
VIPWALVVVIYLEIVIVVLAIGHWWIKRRDAAAADFLSRLTMTENRYNEGREAMALPLRLHEGTPVHPNTVYDLQGTLEQIEEWRKRQLEAYETYWRQRGLRGMNHL